MKRRAEVTEHVRARLGDDQLRDLPSVVRQVQSTSGSKLQRSSTGLREQAPTRISHSGLLAQRYEARVIERKQALVQAEWVAHRVRQ
jgi:hypothetical protein